MEAGDRNETGGSSIARSLRLVDDNQGASIASTSVQRFTAKATDSGRSSLLVPRSTSLRNDDRFPNPMLRACFAYT